MKIYDLYGSASLTPTDLREQVGRELGLVFEEHAGGYRYRDGRRGEELVIRAAEPAGDGQAESPTYQTLLEVNRSPRADELLPVLSALPGLTFLRRDLER